MTLYNDDGSVDETAIPCPHDCGNHNELWDTVCGYCGMTLPVNQDEPKYPVYVEKNFTRAHLEIINHANDVLGQYERQGFKLTLRQLYYQFVSGVPGFPNTEQSYKRLGGIINDARLAGLISFERIEDRGRVSKGYYFQEDPRAVLEDIQFQYSRDVWAEQDYYVEVWVEKDALSSVIERPCRQLLVPYMACKGYMSASAQWEAGNRFASAAQAGKECVLIHLGDHDPSGIDMTRDNGDRLSMFAGEYVDVRRIALNRDQVDHYNPPPNPAKLSDSRARDYVAMHGKESWELDALTPDVIGKLIKAEVNSLIDVSAWNRVLEEQAEQRAWIKKISDNADAVFDFVKDL